jgi:competence protein ComEA
MNPLSTRPPDKQSRQKGIFVFSLVIMGYMAFQFSEATPKPDSYKEIPLSPARVTIESRGLVNRPGITSYDHYPTLKEVIDQAGGIARPYHLPIGIKPEALKQDLTLTFEKQAGERAGCLLSSLSPKALWILGRPIPINRAEAEDLSRLPGIGSKMAERIIVYRDGRGGFTALEQLMEVKGIKEKTFAKIKGHFIL